MKELLEKHLPKLAEAYRVEEDLQAQLAELRADLVRFCFCGFASLADVR